MYKELCETARSHGYAMAVHGSMIRDFDLICIPWIENPSSPDKVVAAFGEIFHILRTPTATIREHGRIVYTINFSFADCFIDLSFMPVLGAISGVEIPETPKDKELMGEGWESRISSNWREFQEANPPKGQAKLYYKDNAEYFKDGMREALKLPEVQGLVQALETVEHVFASDGRFIGAVQGALGKWRTAAAVPKEKCVCPPLKNDGSIFDGVSYYCPVHGR